MAAFDWSLPTAATAVGTEYSGNKDLSGYREKIKK
jgi:hypothetical protein